jgi:hypothetical protein
MSKDEARRLAVEYIDQQLAAMPKPTGRSVAKLSKSRKKSIVASLVRTSKHFKH